MPVVHGTKAHSLLHKARRTCFSQISAPAMATPTLCTRSPTTCSTAPPQVQVLRTVIVPHMFKLMSVTVSMITMSVSMVMVVTVAAAAVGMTALTVRMAI